MLSTGEVLTSLRLGFDIGLAESATVDGVEYVPREGSAGASADFLLLKLRP